MSRLPAEEDNGDWLGYRWFEDELEGEESLLAGKEVG